LQKDASSRTIFVMVQQFPLQDFFEFCQSSWSNLTDKRKPNPNMKYKVSDAVNSALSVFFMQSSSFLAHQQAISEKKKSKSNLRIPTTEFEDTYQWVWDKADELNILQNFPTSLQTKLVALDGMTYHSSKKIHCASCTCRKDKNGEEHYYHSTLLPLLVSPDSSHVLPFFPEMITPQDGHEKQDCERASAKRWVEKWCDPLFQPNEVTFLGDDLFSNQPFCQKILEHHQNFIFVCKPDSHKHLLY